MKRLTLVISVLVLILSCQEYRQITPVQPPEGSRVVLLEEFTGKGCTNCPLGAREIENLLALYDTNLVVVSIHAGFFANPDFFKVGEYDLRTEEGEDIFAMLGPNIGYPAGVVNRIPFNGDFQHGQQAWADFIEQEVVKDPKVEFSIDHTYDAENRRLMVEIDGIAKEDVTGEVRVSIMVAENGIVDAQDDQAAGGIVDNYVHKHVLRGMATQYDGTPVTRDMEIGETFEGMYDMKLDAEWDPGNCDIIAFVSVMKGPKDFVVLQARQVHLLD